MKKLIMVLLSGVLGSTSLLYSQVIVSERTDMHYERQVFGVGVTAGPIEGAGISFRHHLPAPFSYTLNMGIIKVDENLHYAIGGDIQYDLARSTNGRYFVLLGIGYYYSGSTSKNDLKGPLRVGLGMGAEFAVNGPLHVSLLGAFTFFSDGTILPLPHIGIHYYFY
ncbi:MAG: hypothetical protein ABSB78_06480 [Bacteroidota bacterium]